MSLAGSGEEAVQMQDAMIRRQKMRWSLWMIRAWTEYERGLKEALPYIRNSECMELLVVLSFP